MNNLYQKIFNEMIVLIANKYTPELIVKEVIIKMNKIFVNEDFMNKSIDFILNPENQLSFGY
jgi:hypothetical protein